MKKREILYLINLYESCNNNRQISEIEDYKFPKIKELEGEIQTLLGERNRRREIYQANSKELKALQKTCSHEVRHSYPCTFGEAVICVMCGENVDIVEKPGIYNDCNRNNYYCKFPTSYYDEDAGVDIIGVDIETIYDYIKEILIDKDEEESIDLVQEMKKINPKKCSYIEKPYVKEHYVLIIGGSNKVYIDDSHYLSGSSNDSSIELTHQFLGIPKVKVELVENPEAYLTNKFKTFFPYNNTDYGAKFEEYRTESELLAILNEVSEQCPFDLVIDISDIYKLSIEENQLLINQRKLELKTLFPNSKIVRFDNISKIYESSETQEDFDKNILLFLRQQLMDNNDVVIGYRGKESINDYYKKDNNDDSYKVVSGIEEVGNIVKTLALKKQQ